MSIKTPRKDQKWELLEGMKENNILSKKGSRIHISGRPKTFYQKKTEEKL